MDALQSISQPLVVGDNQPFRCLIRNLIISQISGIFLDLEKIDSFIRLEILYFINF